MASKLSDQLVEAQSKLMEADQTAAQLKPIEDAKKHVSPLFLLSPPPEVTPLTPLTVMAHNARCTVLLALRSPHVRPIVPPLGPSAFPLDPQRRKRELELSKVGSAGSLRKG